ncbi:hypothetical protein MMC34_004128, partial [Xylographa carneopallida]|nr:hypothetical protein [Xylographa carneopallida]
MAQPTATENSNVEESNEPLLIPAMVEATGSPPEYLTTYLMDPVGKTRNARIRKSKTSGSLLDGTSNSRGHRSINIPGYIVDELVTMSYSYLLGQGMLIRDASNKHTSFVTIAEAACAQLNGLEDLLECLLIAISRAFSNDSLPVEWKLS